MKHFATLPTSKVIGKVLRDHKPFNDSDLRLGMSDFATLPLSLDPRILFSDRSEFTGTTSETRSSLLGWKNTGLELESLLVE
jgi:hypothetical protein